MQIFLSYSHKNEALVDKFLPLLQDRLQLRPDYNYRIWLDTRIMVGDEWNQDIKQALQDCDLALPLLSPGFFTSSYIVNEEIPPMLDGRLKPTPALLEPLDFSGDDLLGFENLQVYALPHNSDKKPLSKCRGTQLDDFASGLAKSIHEQTPAILRNQGLDFFSTLAADENQLEMFLEENPEIAEQLLKNSEYESRPSSPPSPQKTSSKKRLAALLKGHRKILDSQNLLDPEAATGSLKEVTKNIQDSNSNDNAFESHRRKVIDYLRSSWLANPDGVPFAAILGEIGSGKTTMLQMLARDLADEPNAPPVILIDLRDHKKSPQTTLEDILHEHLRRNDDSGELTIENLLDAVRKERALIIFDGLDERIISLDEDDSRNFIRELWRVLPPDILGKHESSGRGRVIFSCRSHYFPTVEAQTSAYLDADRSTHVLERDYLACVMLPWRDEQIRDYLRQVVGPDRLEQALEVIENVHNLRDLSTRPYLINLIGPELESLERDRAAGRSVNAASLYKKFIERWLHRDKGKHIFSPAHKLRLMQALAAALWRDNAREWPWDQVEEWLEDFLHRHPALQQAVANHPITTLQQDFRTATFFLRPDSSAETFRFAHTSLQEYFFASHLLRALDPKFDSSSSHEAWDLPQPSLETFNFLGQLLQTLSPTARKKSLSSLGDLLANPEAPSQARLIALRYHLHAHSEKFSTLENPDLACAGLDLEGWEFTGTADRPLHFGRVDFSKASLLRVVMEHVNVEPRAQFTSCDLRGARLFHCVLENADFTSAQLDHLFARETNLRGVDTQTAQWEQTLLHLGGTPSPALPPQVRASLTPNLGHSNSITSVAFSPDGSKILSGAHDSTIKVWEASSGKELLSLSGHSGSVTSVAFSPDGDKILSGSYDDTVKVWEASSGKELLSLSGHSGYINSVAFSPDGAMILSGARYHTVKVWEASSGKELLSLSGHTNRVSSVAFSPDGAMILSGAYDKTVKVWEASSGKELLSLSGHSGSVTSVAFSPDGDMILSGAGDRTVKVWETSSGKERLSLSGHSGRVSSVAFSPDGAMILSGAYDNTVKVWEASSGKELLSLSGHSGEVNSVAFSPDGAKILSGSDDNTVKVWEASSGKELLSLRRHSGSVNPVAFSPDGAKILSGAYDSTIKVWEASSGKELLSLSGHSGSVTSVAFSPDGDMILSGSDDNTVKVWEASSGKELLSLSGHSSGIISVAFSPDGAKILSVAYDDTFKVWEASSGKELLSFSRHSSGIISVAFSPDGDKILSGAHDLTVKVWEASSGKELLSLSGHSGSVTSVAFSPDGDKILSGSYDDTVKVWEASSGKELLSLSGHSGGVTSVAFSPDGSKILSGALDNTIKVWEASSGEELLSLFGHLDWIRSVTFSPDGQSILTSSGDGSLQLWESETGIPLRQYYHLPKQQSLAREPWNQNEAAKPASEIRWRLLSASEEAWRYCHAVDLETHEILPPECATCS